MVMAVTLGTGALLAAVGDDLAAGVCRWVALPLGVLWVVAMAATTVLSAAAALTGPGRRRGRGPGHRRRRLAHRRENNPPSAT